MHLQQFFESYQHAEGVSLLSKYHIEALSCPIKIQNYHVEWKKFVARTIYHVHESVRMPQYLGVNAVLQKELLRGLDRHEMLLKRQQNESPDHQPSSETHSSSSASSSTYRSTKSIQGGPAWAYQLLPSLYSHYQKVYQWVIGASLFYSPQQQKPTTWHKTNSISTPKITIFRFFFLLMYRFIFFFLLSTGSTIGFLPFSCGRVKDVWYATRRPLTLHTVAWALCNELCRDLNT